MDYYHFLEEFDTYNEWNRMQKKAEDEMWGHRDRKFDKSPFVKGIDAQQGEKPLQLESPHANNDAWLDIDEWTGQENSDRVNSPSHYTSGKTEVIDIIEDAVKDAPSVIFGMLQGQVLKYVLRVWLKDNPLEDMKKARWYLDRLISHYSEYPGDN